VRGGKGLKPRYDPRVFLALTLSRTALVRLEEIQVQVQEYLASWHYIPPPNFHMTLLFFGDVPEATIPQVCGACRTVATRCTPISLHWNCLDFFGAPHSARVLFAGADSNPELEALAAALDRAFPGVQEERGFRPHITLAKARKDMDRNIALMNANMLRRLREHGRIGPNPMEVDITTVHREFVLMETIWVGRGVEYQVRDRFPFTTAPGE
jgi:RNA 2',3'-cyclic 3'-phosphodiesterase